LALSPKEVKIVKCNGNNLNRNKKKHDVYALHPDYLSQSIVVIGVFHPSIIPAEIHVRKKNYLQAILKKNYRMLESQHSLIYLLASSFHTRKEPWFR
jgi:hypothetical protein